MSFASKMKNLANQARQKAIEKAKENKPLSYEEWRSKFHFEIENAKSHLEEQLILSAKTGEYRVIFQLPHKDAVQIGFYRVAARELGCSMVKRPNILGEYSISFANAAEEPRKEKIIIPPYNEVIRSQDKTYVSPAMDRDCYDEIKPVSDWNELAESWQTNVVVEHIEKPATVPNTTEHPVF